MPKCIFFMRLYISGATTSVYFQGDDWKHSQNCTRTLQTLLIYKHIITLVLDVCVFVVATRSLVHFHVSLQTTVELLIHAKVIATRVEDSFTFVHAFVSVHITSKYTHKKYIYILFIGISRQHQAVPAAAIKSIKRQSLLQIDKCKYLQA